MGWQWLSAIAPKDLYQSPLSLILLLLFGINLVSCSLKRFVKNRNAARRFLITRLEDRVDLFPIVKRFNVNGFNKLEETVSDVLSTYFKKQISLKNKNSTRYFYAEKGKYSNIGFYLAHLSIAVIIVGILISSKGYKSYFEIKEGEVLDPLTILDGTGKKKTLEFSLMCEGLETIYYEYNTAKIKKHLTTLAVIVDGEKKKSCVVGFANPLKYKGFDIYQERYSRKEKFVRIRVASKDGKGGVYKVKNWGSINLPGTDVPVKVVRFYPDHVKLRIGFENRDVLLFKDVVSFSKTELKDYRFSLIDFTERKITTLKIMKDPGKEIVWFGFLSMIAGFCIIFFFSHERVMVMIEKKGGTVLVTMAGLAHKNLQDIESLFVDVQSRCQTG